MTSEPAPSEDTSVAIPAMEVRELGLLDQEGALALTAYRQADVLDEMTVVHVLGPDGGPVPVPAPLGVVLVSQTCDVVPLFRKGLRLEGVVKWKRIPETVRSQRYSTKWWRSGRETG